VEITPESVAEGLRDAGYVTTPRVETALLLALRLEKPLLVEGPAGAGKTELAKVLASTLETRLVRLQCYEGLDEARALFEWNYQKQLLRIHADRATGATWETIAGEIFDRDYLLARPLLQAITAPERVVLLIDEVDKADPEFEAFLLEVLSDWQVSVPELGTLRAETTPVVVLTSNRTRELSDALLRRCLHLALEYPAVEIEAAILARKVPDLSVDLARQVARFVASLRELDLRKAPSVSETIDWARGLLTLGIRELDAAAVRQTLTLLVKRDEDRRTADAKVAAMVGKARRP